MLKNAEWVLYAVFPGPELNTVDYSHDENNLTS